MAPNTRENNEGKGCAAMLEAHTKSGYVDKEEGLILSHSILILYKTKDRASAGAASRRFHRSQQGAVHYSPNRRVLEVYSCTRPRNVYSSWFCDVAQ